MDMDYSIPKAIGKIDWILTNLDNTDVAVRRNAAAWAQYAALGHLPSEKSGPLLEAMANKLMAKVNGHVMLNEPDEYVRERCANGFELASSAGKNITKYLPVLEWSRDYDPHEWVRSMARDALRYHHGLSRDLPLPGSFTTRPSAPMHSDVRELQSGASKPAAREKFARGA
ncbi:MAG TPA: hypothetical protein VLD37_00290 [Candidatus Bilamarchaeum sp.]|nr:hypothetical protein [Candidatus Bilamarchaeum sp.]